MSHTGARASAGHESQACLCGLLSLRALQQKGQWGIAPRQKFWIFVFRHTHNKTTMYHTLVLGHSICTRMRDYLHSGHDIRLCPDFKLGRTNSVEICGRGGLTMTRLMANGGALLNSVMCRVSKEPDIIFLQVGGNDFPRTTRNRRDANDFSLQHRK